MDKYNTKGQSLIEIVVGLAVAGILIGAAAGSTVLVLRQGLDVKTAQVADSLSQEYLEALTSISGSDWHKIYCPPDGNCPGSPKGPSDKLHLTASGAFYAIAAGVTTTLIENRVFTRYFLIENVNRNFCGTGDIAAGAVTLSCLTGWPGGSGDIAEDPSTQKITAVTEGGSGRVLSKTVYLTRKGNSVAVQTDWSGGNGQEGPLTRFNNKFSSSTAINYATSGSIIIQGF